MALTLEMSSVSGLEYWGRSIEPQVNELGISITGVYRILQLDPDLARTEAQIFADEYRDVYSELAESDIDQGTIVAPLSGYVMTDSRWEHLHQRAVSKKQWPWMHSERIKVR